MCIYLKRNKTMKSLLKKRQVQILLLIICISMPNLFAQKKQLQWGVVAGLNLSNYNYYYTQFDKETYSPGFRIGGVGQFHFHPKFSVQGELLLSEQSAQYQQGSLEYRVKHNLLYIKAPLSVKYTPFNNGINIFAGPYISYFIGASSYGGDYIETTKDFDFGSVLGIGYDFPFGLFINARWEQSCINTITSPWRKKAAYNTTFAFSCGWFF